MSSNMTMPGGANTFAPDDEHIKFDAALFDAHNGEEDGIDIDFTDEVLTQIVNACNRRIKDTGDYPPVTDGHTPDDDGPQPEILGYAKDFRIGEIGKLKPRKAIFATLCIQKDKMEKAKQLPRRSIELWSDGIIDPVVMKKKSPIDSVALLGATRPARDLGKMLIKNKKKLYRYSLEEKQNMDHEEIVKKCIEALQSLPEMEYLREMMNDKTKLEKEEEPAKEAKEDGKDEKQIEPKDEKVHDEVEPDGGDEPDEAKLKMAYDATKRKYAKLESDYALLFSKVEAMERSTRHAERRAQLIQLEGEGIAFDYAEEFETVADMEKEKFAKHVANMRKRYQKAPIGSKIRPMQLPLDGDLPAAKTLSAADVYAKTGTPVERVGGI